MTKITLYTKDNCSLCDIVEETLASLHPLYPHELVKIDITADQDLYLKYRYTIPVVTIGQTTLHAPITALQLAEALRAEG